MAKEYDELKQQVLRTHMADLTASGRIAETDYVARGYLDAQGVATPLGEEFLNLHDAGLITRTGELTEEGQVYLTSRRDSFDASPEVFRKREERGLNEIDKTEAAGDSGFWSMMGDFVTKGIPRMIETEANVYSDVLNAATSYPRELYKQATGDEIAFPRSQTIAETVNGLAENLTGGVLASEGLAAGAIFGSEKVLAQIQGKTDEAYAAKQEWEKHNAELTELKGAEMMEFLTGSAEWLKAREELVAQDGEAAVKKNEEFDRLAGNFILDPNNLLSAGVGTAVNKLGGTMARAGLHAEKLATKAKVLRMSQMAATAERATLEAGATKAAAVVEHATERAASFRAVGNEAQALKYDGIAARIEENAAGVVSRMEQLATVEAKLASQLDGIASKAGVAEFVVAANQKIAAVRQFPAQAIGQLTESVGTGLVKTDAFLVEAAERIGIDGVYKSFRSLPGRVGSIALAPVTGAIPAAVTAALGSGPLLQSIGNFSKVLGRELIMERGSVPFWRRVANNSTISKTQRFLAHRMDEATLGGRVAEIGKPIVRGTAAAYPMNLAFNVLADPDHDIGNAASMAFGPSLVFGGGTAGAGAMFKGTKARLKSIRIADEVNFMRTLTDDQLPNYSTISRGARRAVSTYAAAFPNLNWDFTHQGASHYDATTNTARINPASNTPLRALVGHEVLHYVTIRNQMQPVIHSTLLGDSETPGLLRKTDGTLEPEFQKFTDVYNERTDAAGLERRPVESIAEEYFNENVVDHLVSMVESGEVSSMAGRTQAGRKVRALIDATISKHSILKDFFFRTGGVMEAGGRHVMGNGLLAEGLREIPEARAMMRRLVRTSAGEAATTPAKVADSKEGAGSPLHVQKGDPIIDSFHAILETDANGVPLKDKNGDHIALSRAKDEARQSAGHVIAEAQRARVAAGAVPKPGEITAQPDGSWQGTHFDRSVIDALAAKGILNSKQIAILRNINTAITPQKGIDGKYSQQGYRYLITNHPATIKGRGGKARYATLGATLRETVPTAVSITKDGNLLVHLMNVEQLDRNITSRAASKTGKRLYDGNTEVIKQDIAEMMDLHAANKRTDAYFDEKYGPKGPEYKNFINTIFGLMTKAQQEINPMFQADKVTKDGVYRAYRLDRISKATKMDGTPMPFGYTHVKANFLPDGITENASIHGGNSGESGHARSSGTPKIPLSEPQNVGGGNEKTTGITVPLSGFSRPDLSKPWVREERASFADIDGQEAELATWAASNGRLMDVPAVQAIRAKGHKTAQGNEHDVVFSPDGVYRFTNGDKYGMHYRTPSEYLARWDKSNKLFPETATEFVGFYQKPSGVGVIVTRQPFIKGKRGTAKQITDAMAKIGFEPTGNHSFRHPKSGIELFDAHEDNVLFDANGDIMPFDVWVNDPNNALK